jgi:Txe/YoeB family toxin of toxin-antitoxin system
MYRILFYKQAKKDLEKIKTSNLKKPAYNILDILSKDPFQPPFEKLSGSLEGVFSRRINLQHRIIYEVDKEKQIVYIYRMWTHYGDN